MKNIVITLFFVILLAAAPVAFAAECPLCYAIEYDNILLAFLPLFVAAREGNLSEVKRLLDGGVNVNERDEKGVTALLGAAAKGQYEVAKFLLKKGANVDEKNEDGMTALMLVAAIGHSKVAKLLLDNDADVNAADNNGLTALMRAMMRGHAEVTKLLLDNGANRNAKNNNGLTALMLLDAALAAVINVKNREEEKLEKIINGFFN